MVDMSEGALFKQIQKGNPSAIFFHLKTLGKKRGYIERIQTEEINNPFAELMKKIAERKNTDESTI